MKKLGPEFFKRQDVTHVARELLGKRLLTNINNQLTGGLISETEAYDGAIDRASHAWPNKQTLRTAVMFEPGGRTYVYFCYGVHHLLNIVTGTEGVPQAVLIRAIIPTAGIEVMQQRRSKKDTKNLTNGPGKVAQALGLTLVHNNVALGEEIWIEETDIKIPEQEIMATPRIGVDYAGPDKDLPWRFVWAAKS